MPPLDYAGKLSAYDDMEPDQRLDDVGGLSVSADVAADRTRPAEKVAALRDLFSRTLAARP